MSRQENHGKRDVDVLNNYKNTQVLLCVREIKRNFARIFANHLFEFIIYFSENG